MYYKGTLGGAMVVRIIYSGQDPGHQIHVLRNFYVDRLALYAHTKRLDGLSHACTNLVAEDGTLWLTLLLSVA